MKGWLTAGMMILMVGLNACVTSPTNSKGKEVDYSVSADRHLDAGWGYLANNNLTKAKMHLDKAVEYAPKNAEVHRALGHYYDRIGELKDAETQYRYAVDLNGKSGEALGDYGVFLCRQGKYGKAQELFDKAISSSGYDNVAGTLESAGVCMARSGDKEKAEDFFRRALRINPKQAGALVELGYIEFGKNHIERAHQYYQRYSEAAGDTARSLWLGVQINRALDDKDATSSLALKLERLFPDSDEAALLADAQEKWRK